MQIGANLIEYNTHHASVYATELTDRGAAVMLSMGMTQNGTVFTSRNKEMEVKQLVAILEDTITALKKTVPQNGMRIVTG